MGADRQLDAVADLIVPCPTDAHDAAVLDADVRLDHTDRWIDDDGTDDDGTAQTSAATQTTTDATSSETSLSSTTTSTADTTTGDIDVPCGDALTCTSGDVCIEDAFDPSCTNLEDPEGTCPEGQTMTQCGGAGLPCCCLPPPPSEFRCVTPTNCDGPASCDCLGEVCTEGRQCTSLGADPEHLFRCESPPAP